MRQQKAHGAAVAGLLAACAVGCSSATPPSHVTPLTSTSAAPSPARTPGSTPATLSLNEAGNTGIGGLVTAFNAVHTGGDGYSAAASYDQVHVVGFTRTFRGALAKSVALATLVADLPPDAQQVADLNPSTACDEVWFTSAALHKTLDPHAYVYVSLKSPGAFSATGVTSAVVDVDVVGGPGSVGCP